jgi:hypothetical protein
MIKDPMSSAATKNTTPHQENTLPFLTRNANREILRFKIARAFKQNALSVVHIDPQSGYNLYDGLTSVFQRCHTVSQITRKYGIKNHWVAMADDAPSILDADTPLPQDIEWMVVRPVSGEQIFTKNRQDASSNPYLIEHLKNDKLIFIDGVHASLCIADSIKGLARALPDTDIVAIYNAIDIPCPPSLLFDCILEPEENEELGDRLHTISLQGLRSALKKSANAHPLAQPQPC